VDALYKSTFTLRLLLSSIERPKCARRCDAVETVINSLQCCGKFCKQEHCMQYYDYRSCVLETFVLNDAFSYAYYSSYLD